MDIWKVNEFNFLNEQVEELTSRRSQPWLMQESLATYIKKPLNIVYEAQTDYIFSFFYPDMVMRC